MGLEEFVKIDLQDKFGSAAFDVIDGIDRPTRESYGYCINDINGDNVDELILLREDFFVLAIYTLNEGKICLLDSFWYRHRGMVLNTGEIYIRSSGGADYTIYKVQRLEKNSQTLTTVREFGVDGPDNYYLREEDGNIQRLTVTEFSEMVSSYPRFDDVNIQDYYEKSVITFKKAYNEENYEVISESENHKFVSSAHLYYCYFYDENGMYIRNEGPISRPTDVEIVENRYVKFRVSAGTGLSTKWGYYYDIDENRFSESFYWIFDEINGLVAYGCSDKVVVRDIFDETKYYKEIFNFKNELYEAIEAITNAEFSHDGKSISITYLTPQGDSDAIEVTEIFEL